MSNPWDQRYASDEYVYGTKPNVFFKSQIEQLTPGKILMVAEGEGRNAVHAAEQGWEVTAFDSSLEGQKKAERLAEKAGVHILYEVGELASLEFEQEAFDALGIIFAHFPHDRKADYLQRLLKYLKPGGIVIFEAYGKGQIAYRESKGSKGGPPDVRALYSVAELQEIFKGMDMTLLRDEEVELQEGSLHTGTSQVVRFVGKKPV